MFRLRFILRISLCVALATAVFASSAASAASFRYEVWIAYWHKADGAADAIANIHKIYEISPFSYEVKADGTLVDKMKLGDDPWPGLFASARADRTLIIPTVSWQNGDAIDTVLGSSTLRAAHEAQIVNAITAGGFNGVDVDYENKKAETKANFSKFLKELSAKLHATKKTLTCSIEARTPLSSRFAVAPKSVQYANDFFAIGTYCDQVRLMSYVQGSVDIKLNKQKGSDQLYAPIADPDWIRKVVAEALKSIKRSKLVLAVPTFGYEYQVQPAGLLRNYQVVKSLSYQDALALASSTGQTPVRGSSGEMTFSYTASSSVYYVSYIDATSLAQKVKLAKTLGLRGVALFKLEGDNDPAMWAKMP